MGNLVAQAKSQAESLLQVARQYGTPTYAYDTGRCHQQIDKLRQHLPPEVDILYSLKANPALGLCSLLAGWGFGADVASAGELHTALKAGFPSDRIVVSGPYKSPELLADLHAVPSTVLSVDSLSEFQTLALSNCPHRILLRLRPDFDTPAVVATGKRSRFGIPFEELAQCRDVLASSDVSVVGFHVFSGSQVLDTMILVRHLRQAMELACRAADVLRMTPEFLNLGGGFGIPYAPEDPEIDLDIIAQALQSLIDHVFPVRIVLELGRYLVAQAGWYLTTVVSHQTYGDVQAVVVDGGIHHRADLCGIGLHRNTYPPVVVQSRESPLIPTHVLGCLCLPDDVLAESAPLPKLAKGDILAFPNAGAYGFSASPVLFLGHPAPAEVAFEGMMTELLRGRPSAKALVEGQTHLVRLATGDRRAKQIHESS